MLEYLVKMVVPLLVLIKPMHSTAMNGSCLQVPGFELPC